jgi:membrane protein YqaA with SNARE-associated domain
MDAMLSAGVSRQPLFVWLMLHWLQLAIGCEMGSTSGWRLGSAVLVTQTILWQRGQMQQQQQHQVWSIQVQQQADK